MTTLVPREDEGCVEICESVRGEVHLELDVETSGVDYFRRVGGEISGVARTELVRSYELFERGSQPRRDSSLQGERELVVRAKTKEIRVIAYCSNDLLAGGGKEVEVRELEDGQKGSQPG